MAPFVGGLVAIMTWRMTGLLADSFVFDAQQFFSRLNDITLKRFNRQISRVHDIADNPWI